MDTRPTYIVNVAKGDATSSDSNTRFDAVTADVSFFRVAPVTRSEVFMVSTVRAPRFAACQWLSLPWRMQGT